MIRNDRSSHARQTGAAAIEFSLVLLPLFVVFYSTVVYGYTFLLRHSLVSAADEALRSALRVGAVDGAPTPGADIEAVVENTILDKATGTGRLSWLPKSKWDYVDVEAVADSVTGIVSVEIKYNEYKTQAPVPPLISVPGWGAEVPPVPDTISATAAINMNRPIE